MLLRVAGHDLFNYFAVQYHHFIRSVVSSTAGFQGFRCGRHLFFFSNLIFHKLFSGTLPHSNHRLFAQIEVGKIENKNNTLLDAHGTTKNTFKVWFFFSSLLAILDANMMTPSGGNNSTPNPLSN